MNQSKKHKKILIVEDEGIVAKDLESRLVKLGYTVTGISSSGEEALQLIDDQVPDIVLMDIKLEGELDGIQTTEKILECFTVPIIYVTAYSDEQTLQRAKITEPYGYILKPIKDRELQIILEMAHYKHHMEQNLIENQQWLQTLLKSISEGVIATDTSGSITYLNTIAEQLTGWPNDDALKQNISNIFRCYHERTLKQIEFPLVKVLRTGHILRLSTDVIMVSQRNVHTPVEISIAPIVERKGEARGVVSIIRDISERKENDRLKQDFIATVSHELKTPLTPIVGALEILYLQMADSIPPHAFDVLEIAYKSSKNFMRLIRDILDISNIEFRKMEFRNNSCDLIEVIEKAIEANQAYARQLNINYVLEKKVKKARVYVDEDRLIQALTNLITNAAKFSPPGQNVTITLSQNDASFRVSISDHGPGIPRNIQSKIFQKFVQADNLEDHQKGGSGLGLSISKAIVERLKGSIGYKTDPKQGTVFYFEIPEWSEDEEEN